MRFFNIAGPCIEGMHYMLPPLDRIPEARRLVDRGSYFVIHAPRQSGKTTSLRALAKALTEEGRYAALAFSCETAAMAGDDYAAAQRAILLRRRHAPHRRARPVAPEGRRLAARGPRVEDAPRWR